MRLTSRKTVVLLFLLILVTRLLFLEADPSFIKRVGDISDETVWGIDARNFLLAGNPFIGDIHYGLDSSPLYVYFIYLSSMMFGVNLFSLRIVAALSGIVTSIVLYAHIRKTAGERQAVIALALFGLGNALFMYNRLGLIENTLSLFLYLSFMLYLSREKHWIFLPLAGLVYGIAMVTKATALFFFPAFLCYWAYEWFRKQYRWKDTIVFLGTSAIAPIIFIAAFLIPYWSILKKGMLLHGKNNFFATTFFTNSFKLLGNNLLGLPTVLILLILLTIWILTLLSRMETITFRNLIHSLTPLEAMACSWLLGGLFGIFFSDVSDRRLLIMFIPAIILVSSMITNFKGFSLRQLAEKMPSSAVLYLFAFFPVFSLPFFTLRWIAKDTMLLSIVGIMLTVLFLAVPFAVARYVRAMPSRGKHTFHLFLLAQFLFFMIFNPLTTFIRQSMRHVLIIISKIEYENMAVILGIVVVLALLSASFLRWKKKGFMIHTKHIRMLVATYFILSILLIGQVLAFPQYSMKEGMAELARNTVEGNFILGSGARSLYYETDLLYLIYLPEHKRYHSLHRDLEKYSPRYLLYDRIFDGKKVGEQKEGTKVLNDLSQRYDMTFVTTIRTLPYPGTEKYKIEADLYEIKFPESRLGFEVSSCLIDKEVVV